MDQLYTCISLAVKIINFTLSKIALYSKQLNVLSIAIALVHELIANMQLAIQLTIYIAIATLCFVSCRLQHIASYCIQLQQDIQLKLCTVCCLILLIQQQVAIAIAILMHIFSIYCHKSNGFIASHCGQLQLYSYTSEYQNLRLIYRVAIYT